MTLANGTHEAASQPAAYAQAIGLGLLIALAGIGPWTVLAPLNARIAPEWPWAAVATGAWLVVLITWLNGIGWLGRWRAFRRFHLRLWRPAPDAWRGENLYAIIGLMLLLAAIYPMWIALAPAGTPDLSPYPTIAYRISLVVMGAVVSGVVEEVAYRGYMQSQLERFGASTAITVSAIVFALSHLVGGIDAVLMLPGYFVAGMLFGWLAFRCGSLIPGMIIHSAGDAAYTFFGVLKGDASLLVVG